MSNPKTQLHTRIMEIEGTTSAGHISLTARPAGQLFASGGGRGQK